MVYPLTHKQAVSRSIQLEQSSIHYVYHLRLEMGEHYEGLAELTFRLRHTDSDTFFDYSGKQVLALYLNGSEVQIKHDGSRLLLPRTSLLIGENVAVVRFRSQYDKDGNGLMTFVDLQGKQYLYTQFPPYYCNRVLPVFDQPDLKARMTLNIVAPVNWRVLSNEAALFQAPFNPEQYLMNVGSRQMQVLADYLRNCIEGTMHFHHPTQLLSNYLFCFVAGEYAEIACPNPYKEMKMSLYCINQLHAHLERLAPFIWEITIHSMRFFESFFGRVYPFRKYEIVFAHEYKWGAMENAGLVTFNDNYVYTEKGTSKKMFNLARVLSHELSHHWFGNLVTMRWWDDVWLNESFADLASFVCLEEVQPLITTVKYESAMTIFQDRKNWGYKDDEAITTHPIRGPVANTDEAESIFDGITYSKGAAVLKQLMFIIGKNSFSKALATYFERFAWRNTSLDDFIEALQEQFSGHSFSLDSWKKQWIETACHNTLEVVWKPSCSEAVVKQGCILEEHPTKRRHKIQFAMFHEDCSFDVAEEWVLAQEFTPMRLPFSSKHVAVLPNFGDFTFAKVLLDAQSASFFSRNIARISDSLSRAILWKAFLDMVTDARICSRHYTEVLLANIAEESCDILFQTQLEAAATVVTSYTPIQFQHQLADRVFNFLLSLFAIYETTKPDRLLIVAGSLLKFALSQSAISVLLRWHKQQYQPLVSYKMTFDQQWQTVVKAFTLKGLEFQQKEQLFMGIAMRTAKSTIENRRLLCDAINASREEFERIYQLFLNDGDMRPSLRLALMTGFSHPVHRDWMDEEYAARYFRDVPVVAQFQTSDAAIRFLEDLQPACTDTQWLVRQYEALLPKIQAHHRLWKKANKILHNIRKYAAAHQFWLSNVSRQ